MDQRHKNILREHYVKMVEILDPKMLIPHLPCLSNYAQERITTCYEMRSRSEAVQVLHDAITKRPEGFQELVKALRHPAIGLEAFADKLDPPGHGATSGVPSAVYPVTSSNHTTFPRRRNLSLQTKWSELPLGVKNSLKRLDIKHMAAKGPDDLAECIDIYINQEYEDLKARVNGNLTLEIINDWNAKTGGITLENIYENLVKLERLDIVTDIQGKIGVVCPHLLDNIDSPAGQATERTEFFPVVDGSEINLTQASRPKSPCQQSKSLTHQQKMHRQNKNGTLEEGHISFVNGKGNLYERVDTVSKENQLPGSFSLPSEFKEHNSANSCPVNGNGDIILYERENISMANQPTSSYSLPSESKQYNSANSCVPIWPVNQPNETDNYKTEKTKAMIPNTKADAQNDLDFEQSRIEEEESITSNSLQPEYEPTDPEETKSKQLAVSYLDNINKFVPYADEKERGYDNGAVDKSKSEDETLFAKKMPPVRYSDSMSEIVPKEMNEEENKRFKEYDLTKSLKVESDRSATVSERVTAQPKQQAESVNINSNNLSNHKLPHENKSISFTKHRSYSKPKVAQETNPDNNIKTVSESEKESDGNSSVMHSNLQKQSMVDETMPKVTNVERSDQSVADSRNKQGTPFVSVKQVKDFKQTEATTDDLHNISGVSGVSFTETPGATPRNSGRGLTIRDTCENDPDYSLQDREDCYRVESTSAEWRSIERKGRKDLPFSYINNENNDTDYESSEEAESSQGEQEIKEKNSLKNVAEIRELKTVIDNEDNTCTETAVKEVIEGCHTTDTSQNAMATLCNGSSNPTLVHNSENSIDLASRPSEKKERKSWLQSFINLLEYIE